MKKYLFLLFLFFVYLILISNPKTISTFKEDNNYSINEFYIYFNNGLNSKKIGSLLDGYSDDYLIKEIFIKNRKTSISCSNFKKCEKNIYDILDNEFEIKNIASGFKVDKMLIITNKEKIKHFLTLRNINYNIINYEKNSSL